MLSSSQIRTRCRRIFVAGCLAAMGAGLLSAASGCGDLWKNLTKEKTGNVTVTFINTTAYRAAFTYGAYDAWDHGPGSIDFRQLALDGNSSNAPATLTCARNIAIGTQDMVQRVLDTKGDQNTTGFVPEQFDAVVHFSDAPSGSDAAFLPTKGTAKGREVLLGVDFSCADTLIFTFVEDPDAEGGFRIDVDVILDVLSGE